MSQGLSLRWPITDSREFETFFDKVRKTGKLIEIEKTNCFHSLTFNLAELRKAFQGGKNIAHTSGAEVSLLKEEPVFLRNVKRWTITVLLVVIGTLAINSSAFADDSSRRIKSKVDPVYPELARRMNVTGSVKVQITIAPNGSVKSTKVIGGHPLLIDPAVEAIKKWRYEPSTEESTETVEFKFSNN